MKLSKKIVVPILKSASIPLVVILIFIFATNSQPNALLVNADITTNINLNDDNMVSIVQNNTDTTYLHKIVLINNKIAIQLHFENMVQLVEHLDDLIHEYSYFYLNIISNVEFMTIEVSAQTSHNLIYKINIAKLDYLAGKMPEILPLSPKKE